MSKPRKRKARAKSGPVPPLPESLEVVSVRHLRANLKQIVSNGLPVFVGSTWRRRALFVPIENGTFTDSQGDADKVQKINAAASRAVANLTP
jgi:hypothetical protein